MFKVDIKTVPNLLAKISLFATICVFIVQSISKRWFWPQLWPNNFEFEETLSNFGDAIPLLWTTFIVAALVSLIGIILSAPLAWLIYNIGQKYRIVLILLVLFPALIPPVVSGIGYSIWFIKIDFDGNTAAVVAAHLLISLPYMLGIALSILFRQDRELFEASAGLGWSGDQIFFRIALPLMRAGLYLAAFVGFTISWGQYLLTVLVGNGQVVTLPMVVVSLATSADQTRFAALVLITMLVPALVTVLYHKVLNKTGEYEFANT